MATATRRKPTRTEHREKEANWFYQFWPDIRKQLVVTMFLSIGTGIVTIVTLSFNQVEINKDMAAMQATVNRLDSLVRREHYNEGSEKDSIIQYLMHENKKLKK